jgi:hypothetical protein
MNLHAQWLAYTRKVFHLNQLVQGIRDTRPYPVIPTRPVVLSLLLGAVLRRKSYLQVAAQTRRRSWQRLIHWDEPLSHDTLEYVAERLELADLRRTLAAVAKQLKTNKALESCKLNGLLFLSLDANEHFKSRSRCCEQCCQRTLEETDAHGQKHRVIEYYHRYVFAQLNGPKLNVVLDVEPIRPGEGEAAAALRLLGRLRRVYGPRFFDAVTVDAWYVQGPFLKAVTKLGWAWVVVLKQEALTLLQEARALSQGQTPQLEFNDPRRQRDVQLWAVEDLTLSDTYPQPVRVVHTHEQWTEVKVLGGQKTKRAQSSDWWWVASPELRGYPAPLVYHAGHRRWGIENQAFNELTQFYHLPHCYHHEPVAMLAQMLILLLGFVLFNAFVALHCQPLRLGQMSRQELVENLNLALAEDLPWDQWFESG